MVLRKWTVRNWLRKESWDIPEYIEWLKVKVNSGWVSQKIGILGLTFMPIKLSERLGSFDLIHWSAISYQEHIWPLLIKWCNVASLELANKKVNCELWTGTNWYSPTTFVRNFPTFDLWYCSHNWFNQRGIISSPATQEQSVQTWVDIVLNEPI